MQKLIASFFYQIVYMSIIATVIGFVILFLRKVTHKRLSPNCHYIIWLVFVMALICPIAFPSRISIYNYFDVEKVKQSRRQVSSSIWDYGSEEFKKNEIQNSFKRVDRNINKVFKEYSTYIIPDIWFAIFLLNLSRVIYGYVVLHRLTGNKELADERIIRILERCKRKLKIKKNIKVIEQNLIKTPSTMTIFNVKIFLPDEILILNDIYITDILMHELSHYKRRDNILNVFIMIAECMHWINPFIGSFFKVLKSDIELATDEMAVKYLEEDEKLEYCKVILEVAQRCKSKLKVVLGLSDDIKVLEKRVDMILMKEKFEKYSKSIMLSTISIVLSMWLILYPTSYGIFDVPRLYVKLTDGTQIEIGNKEETEIKTIKIAETENLKLFTKGRRCEDFVAYERTNLTNQKSYIQIVNMKSSKIRHFQLGEYLYKFTLKYGKDKSIEYEIKIIVE